MSETMLPNRRHRVPISIAIAAALVVASEMRVRGAGPVRIVSSPSWSGFGVVVRGGDIMDQRYRVVNRSSIIRSIIAPA